MPLPNEITALQLNRLIGTPDCPAIVDVCVDADFRDDPNLIPGSMRHPHTDLPGLVERLGGKPCIVVCQKGRKLSQGAAAWLRGEGLAADYLRGGMYGWRDTPGTMRVPAGKIPGTVGEPTLWVTRHRPGIDGIACLWLIRRFVDPAARFLFVAPSEVTAVAGRFGATAVDEDGAVRSHRGDHCSFDTMLDEFQLHSPALDNLARVVRAAGTDRHDLSPQAAGLLAVWAGLSRQHEDDQRLLRAGLELCDALFSWACDRVDEGHERPADRCP
ncbi:MAG: chromate resistance protein [Rhodobacter sp.]|nr:chromate resistance protein [Rhodobacter sp.]